MAATIKSIWYDMEGVTGSLDFFHLFSILARLSGMNPDKIRFVLWGSKKIIHPESPADRFDRGLLQEGEFIALLHSELRLGGEVSFDRLRDAITRFIFVSGEVLRIMHFLRDPRANGVRRFIQGVVSDTNFLHWSDTLAKFPTLRMHDPITHVGAMDFHSLSFRIGLKKPHPAIFWDAFVKASLCHYKEDRCAALRRGECLFFDDKKPNVRAARKFGVRAVWVDRDRPEESIIAGLQAHGVPVPDGKWNPPQRQKSGVVRSWPPAAADCF